MKLAPWTIRMAKAMQQVSESCKSEKPTKILEYLLEQSLKMVITTYVVIIPIIESLILAQDERWRRA